MSLCFEDNWFSLICPLFLLNRFCIFFHLSFFLLVHIFQHIIHGPGLGTGAGSALQFFLGTLPSTSESLSVFVWTSSPLASIKSTLLLSDIVSGEHDELQQSGSDSSPMMSLWCFLFCCFSLLRGEIHQFLLPQSSFGILFFPFVALAIAIASFLVYIFLFSWQVLQDLLPHESTSNLDRVYDRFYTPACNYANTLYNIFSLLLTAYWNPRTKCIGESLTSSFGLFIRWKQLIRY